MISIIIPTLNEEKYLPLLLDSIKKQSYQDYEIIVSDGCSDDKTLEVAKAYGCKTILAKKDERHPSIQRNNGAKIAQGDILLFLDADTALPNNKFLEIAINDFKKRGMGVAGFFMDFQSKKFFYRFYYSVYNSLAFLAQYIKPLAVGAGIIIKKDLHNYIGGFDEKVFIGEDQIYCEQAAKKEKFRLIKNTKIFFSIRRFEKVGRWKMFGNLVYSVLYVLIFGPIRKKIINYDFGDFKN
ncbi:MAG TPA: glycosyltransferase [bacterium]|nr:glycosyltransferase [bacterium]